MGFGLHKDVILEHARDNAPVVRQSIRDLPPLSEEKSRSCIIVCAGPSVRRKNSIQRIVASGYSGTVIAVDGAYVACLDAGLIPDFVLTLDPDRSRIVRWFGDPDIERHAAEDDYFRRQDLDVEFRHNMLARNQKNIALVDRYASQTKAVVCAVVHHGTVVQRLLQAQFPLYWWNPLVDSVEDPKGLTRQLYAINPLPCLNTGGTVGTAAWVFASQTLGIAHIGVVGMDYGYYENTPYRETQRYPEILEYAGGEANLPQFFVSSTFPLTGERFYTDVTYHWYRANFLELLSTADGTTYNCTEGGTLVDERIPLLRLDDFLSQFSDETVEAALG